MLYLKKANIIGSEMNTLANYILKEKNICLSCKTKPTTQF